MTITELDEMSYFHVAECACGRGMTFPFALGRASCSKLGLPHVRRENMSAEDDKIAFDLDEERFGPQDTWSDGTPLPPEPVAEPIPVTGKVIEERDEEPDDFPDPDGWKDSQDAYERHMFRDS